MAGRAKFYTTLPHQLPLGWFFYLQLPTTVMTSAEGTTNRQSQGINVDDVLEVLIRTGGKFYCLWSNYCHVMWYSGFVLDLGIGHELISKYITPIIIKTFR